MDNLEVIKVLITSTYHFAAQAPCGRSWSGMRHSDDVRVIIDRAMDHVAKCDDCVTTLDG